MRASLEFSVSRMSRSAKRAAFVSAIAAAILGAAPALAHVVVYTAALDGATESPSVPTDGTGTAVVTMDFDLKTMRVQVGFEDLTGTVTASHIHCCTPPANVGVATIVPTFPGFPLDVTAGTYDQTFDMSLASSYNPGFISSHGGTVDSAFQALVDGLDAQTAYLNIHSTFRSGGEIRGFLQAVPEPQTWALMGAGLGGLLLLARRRMG